MTSSIPTPAPCGMPPHTCINAHDDDGGEPSDRTQLTPDGTSADDYTYTCTVCALEMSAGEVGDHVCYPD
jgi:hypothetical protein